MIESLYGELIHKDAQGAVVQCAGVGYGVRMSLSSLAHLGNIGETVRLFVYTHVGQDVLRLYGFMDEEERRTFVTLLGTTGVGPKLALAVLSTFSSAELVQAVTRVDTAALVRIPGVGKKTAERLLVELKDRLPKAMLAGGAVPAAPLAAAADLAEDLLLALIDLGFNRGVAEKVSRQILNENAEEKDLARLVRLALRASTRK